MLKFPLGNVIFIMIEIGVTLCGDGLLNCGCVVRIDLRGSLTGR